MKKGSEKAQGRRSTGKREAEALGQLSSVHQDALTWALFLKHQTSQSMLRIFSSQGGEQELGSESSHIT